MDHSEHFKRIYIYLDRIEKTSQKQIIDECVKCIRLSVDEIAKSLDAERGEHE